MTKINKKEKIDKFESCEITKQSTKQLIDLVSWAVNEITEYKIFIKLIRKEINKRK